VRIIRQRPDPAPTEVLVKVAAAGVNPVDWKTRSRGGMLGSPPFTGGGVAGVVEELGLGSRGPRRGIALECPGSRARPVPTPSS
jgi:NADPH:quinone reductase-like Zn-dependent oxidoreductase